MLFRLDLFPLFGCLQRADWLGHARGIEDLFDLLLGQLTARARSR
jgi:hypothetical protein